MTQFNKMCLFPCKTTLESRCAVLLCTFQDSVEFVVFCSIKSIHCEHIHHYLLPLPEMYSIIIQVQDFNKLQLLHNIAHNYVINWFEFYKRESYIEHILTYICKLPSH